MKLFLCCKYGINAFHFNRLRSDVFPDDLLAKCPDSTGSLAPTFLPVFLNIFVQILQLPETQSPFSLAVFNDMVYWSDTQRLAIFGAHKNTGKNSSVILKRPGQPFGLKVSIYFPLGIFGYILIENHYLVSAITVAFVQVVHQLMQPRMKNPCENLRCSNVCLLTLESQAVCRCPSGLLLAADGFTCSPPEDTSSSFLLALSPSTLTQVRQLGVSSCYIHCSGYLDRKP